MAAENPQPAGGCNCNGFCSGTTSFAVFFKQLTSCVAGNHISEEEKTGIMWWKKPHKGCGSLDSAHSAFISWLTLMVWAQFASSLVYFILLMILPLEVCQGSFCVEVRTSSLAAVPMGCSYRVHLQRRNAGAGKRSTWRKFPAGHLSSRLVHDLDVRRLVGDGVQEQKLDGRSECSCLEFS